jgi:phosphatidylserine/phosphatidylglycerophosphate/cardiolipin synthase-like enzyme
VRDVELIVEPDDGVAPILNAIRHARESLDLTIFRFDHQLVADALGTAVKRGVRIRALIAASNRHGSHHLRRLEWRLLASGVTVSRASEAFTRYHAKMMIVDGGTLHVHGFNCTLQDLASRSLGIVTTNRQLVSQAARLFAADLTHHSFDSGSGGLVVSPENARGVLEAFVGGARRQLLIYDSKLTDCRFTRLLEERMTANVDVRVIGHIEGHCSLPVTKLRGRRLHLRAIIRDGSSAFVGSQGLHRVELDSRREVGLFVHEPAIVRHIHTIFEHDWARDIAAVEAQGAAEMRK